MFHVRCMLDSNVLFRRHSGFNGLMAEVIQLSLLLVNILCACSCYL